MINQALGMIETFSLSAAIEAADAACKSADVELVGYELAKGGGLVTVKVLGQVGAVQAAVDAAKAAASGVNRVVATSVIARPSDQLDLMVRNSQTVGHRPTPGVGTDAPAPSTTTKKKEEEK